MVLLTAGGLIGIGRYEGWLTSYGKREMHKVRRADVQSGVVVPS
jgi:hypothetical protein